MAKASQPFSGRKAIKIIPHLTSFCCFAQIFWAPTERPTMISTIFMVRRGGGLCGSDGERGSN